MISFKHFTGREPPAAGDLLAAQQRMIACLLDGMVIHAVRGDPADYQRLESDLGSFRKGILGQSTPQDLLIGTGKVLKALQEYNRSTTLFTQGQGRELQKMTAMLTETILHLTSIGEGNASRLQAIERQLEKASALEDMRQLKDRLADCLTNIREERIRQQAGSSQAADGLARDLDSLRGRAAAGGPRAQFCDTLTGLESRPEAERALAGAIDTKQNAFAALFVIDRLHSVNARFGRKLGDEIVLTFARHLVQKLRAEDVVFRWSGPSFLAILKREGNCEKVRRESTPLLKTRIEKTVEANGRTVLLPISFTWHLFPALDFDRATDLVSKIDACLAQAGPES